MSPDMAIVRRPDSAHDAARFAAMNERGALGSAAVTTTAIWSRWAADTWTAVRSSRIDSV